MTELWECLTEEKTEKQEKERGKVFAFLGAGGKTTCMLELARYLADKGKKVLVTTSVHMEAPEVLGVPGLVDPKAEEIIEFLCNHGWVVAGRSCSPSESPNVSERGLAAESQEPNEECQVLEHPSPRKVKKIQALEPQVYRKAALEADVILLEADGSRKYPVKVPAPWEPVFWEAPDVIYILAGASGLYCPVFRVCHRLEYVEKILGDREKILTPDKLGLLLEKGYVERMREKFPHARLHVILNQADVLQEPENTKNQVQEQVSVPLYLRGKREKFVHLILLAAGFSRRFGENKLLYPVDGRPMYTWLFQALWELAGQRTEFSLTVVSQYHEILEYAGSQGALAVRNFHSERGISSSLQLGIQETEKEFHKNGVHYFCFFAADQPYLRKETVESFLQAFLDSRKKLGALSFGGIPGNPVIFHEEYVPELLALTGDRGGKKILLNHLEETFLYEVENEKELMDCDRKEGL